MDEENTNLNDTIQNDLENRKNIDSLNQIEREAKRKTKDAAKKGTRKALKSLFKPVTWSSLIGFAPFLIIAFFIIGVVGFITTMPGMVQEEILNKITEGINKISEGVYGADYYLEELAKDTEHTAQKRVLMYLDDMGIDPVGFGFAPFYSRNKETNEVTYDPNIGTEDIVEYGGPVGLIDAIKNDKELAEKVKDEDLIFKYIVSNERTYLIHDEDKIFPKIFGGSDLTGMIKTKIEGLDDSVISVDRDKKQMIITSKNWSEWSNQTAKYNLEDWTGRYGMPLEFLLALHIGTMSSDLTMEMLSNPDLQTEVNVKTEKGDYGVRYDITYDGEELGIPRGKQSPNVDLIEWNGGFGENYVKKDENDKCYVDISEEDIQDMYDDNVVSINSLYQWIKSVDHFNFNQDLNSDAIVRLAYEAKDALMAEDDSAYRIMYQIMADRYHYYNYRNTVYMGETHKVHNDEYHTSIDGSFFDDGYDEESSEPTQGWYVFDGNYVSVDGATDENGCEGLTVRDENDNSSYYDDGNIYTAVLHSIPYYIDHPDEVRNHKYVRLGLTCVLSQLDSMLHRGNLESFCDVQFTFYGMDDELPLSAALRTDKELSESEKCVYLLLAQDWMEACEGMENKSDAQIRADLQRIQGNIDYYFEIIDNKDRHIQEVVTDLLTKLGLENLTVESIEVIHDALENEEDEFEFALPRIQYVIKHWYKDVIFEGAGVDVYKKIDDDIVFPVELEDDLDGKLSVKAVLSYEDGAKPRKQISQPYVVKGDVVTLDGEVVEEGEDGYELSNSEIDGYRLGDGYRITKKLFTQGQYYVFDGTSQTSRSIFYARELEKLEAGECAEVSVKEGRILTEHKIASPVGSVIAETDSWIIYQESVANPRVKFYCVQAKEDLNYVSTGSTDSDIVEKSKKSVEKINGMLETMDIVTTRKPISFDNTTANGDVTTLTAFNLLAGMHSESAEYIYKDFKEFLIELGYYTKAEFEYLDTKVLDWFIPDYKPDTNEERTHWNQVKEEDALKYGAIIYPQKANESGDIVQKGFEPDLAVVAPGNAKIIRKEANVIELEFDASNQPEIAIVDKFVMQITGINVTTSKGVGDSVDAKEEIGKTTEKQQIQVVMMNRRGGFVSDVQDYMGPEPKEISLENDYNVDTTSGQNLVTSEEEFRSLFSDYKVIADNAGAFMEMQETYHVNAVFAAAVAIVESSGGTNGTLVANGNGDPYNMFSVGVWANSLSNKQFDWTNTSLSHWMRYDSWEQSILDFGNFIVNAPYYYKMGNNTVSSIAEHYCPPTAEDWARDVSRIMTERLRQLQ